MLLPLLCLHTCKAAGCAADICGEVHGASLRSCSQPAGPDILVHVALQHMCTIDSCRGICSNATSDFALTAPRPGRRLQRHQEDTCSAQTSDWACLIPLCRRWMSTTDQALVGLPSSYYSVPCLAGCGQLRRAHQGICGPRASALLRAQSGAGAVAPLAGGGPIGAPDLCQVPNHHHPQC